MARADYTPPPRGLLWAKPYSGGDGQGIELACDCGHATIYIIADADQITVPQDIAMTCDGCNSTTWITVGPLTAIGSEEENCG